MIPRYRTQTGVMLVGTYPHGPHLAVPETSILNIRPELHPGIFCYGDDGRGCCLLLAQRGPGSAITWAAASDMGFQTLDAAMPPAVCGPDPEAVEAGVDAYLARIGFDHGCAHWVVGGLDDEGYPPSPYLFEGVCLDGDDPEECDAIFIRCWHPELRRQALESRLGVLVTLWRLDERHILATGMAAAETVRAEVERLQGGRVR
jgi:hypothetical protein